MLGVLVRAAGPIFQFFFQTPFQQFFGAMIVVFIDKMPLTQVRWRGKRAYHTILINKTLAFDQPFHWVMVLGTLSLDVAASAAETLLSLPNSYHYRILQQVS